MNTLKMAKQALLHPLDFFYDIQFLGSSKLISALIIIILAVAARGLSLTTTGFSFQTKEPYQISAVMQAIWIIVPWLTWSVTNWAVSTIIDGEGKFVNVLSASAFVFVPYIAFMLPFSLFSNLLSLSEQMIVTIVTWFIYLWVALLILMQVKVVHDFEPGKTVWISLLTLAGMFILWFIGFLIFGLINQAVSFAVDIYKELMFRL
jgi:hypothetical protein